MSELRVGTSGWTYPDWRGRFYPSKVKQKDYLEWYARHFTTTEINYSFYHLPKLTTYQNWVGKVPESFVFAVKASRYMTHVRRLDGIAEDWKIFLENASVLGDKLGPILLQFPPTFKWGTASGKLLTGFLEASRELGAGKLAFEFRHSSCFDPDVLELMRQFGAALVIADSERYPRAPGVPTASFIYLRFHGPGQLFASRYSAAELKPWAERIRAWLAGGRPVYAYFNNDFEANAIANAKQLAKLVGGLSKSAATAHR